MTLQSADGWACVLGLRAGAEAGAGGRLIVPGAGVEAFSA
jgi:hypothetical protein